MGIGLWGLSPLCEIGISRVSIPNDHLKDTGTWWWLLQKGERTCSSSWNRLVRTRMLGGVGRVPGNGHPYPISVLFCLPYQVSCGRILGLIPNDGITFLTGYESIYGLFVEVERIES
jgi:hypothetical protein